MQRRVFDVRSTPTEISVKDPLTGPTGGFGSGLVEARICDSQRLMALFSWRFCPLPMSEGDPEAASSADVGGSVGHGVQLFQGKLPSAAGTGAWCLAALTCGGHGPV